MRTHKGDCSHHSCTTRLEASDADRVRAILGRKWAILYRHSRPRVGGRARQTRLKSRVRSFRCRVVQLCKQE